MTRLTTLRDLTVTAAGLALVALAAEDILPTGTPWGRKAGRSPLPTPSYGWLCRADGDLARRLRPATAAEAAASAASRANGHGGWFGLGHDGRIVAPADPDYTRAGRNTHDLIDAVFVDGTLAGDDSDGEGQEREQARLTADVVAIAERVDVVFVDGNGVGDVAAAKAADDDAGETGGVEDLSDAPAV